METEAQLAVIMTDLKYIKENFASHVHEAEKPGGRHDRLLLAEAHITALQNELICLKRWVLWAGIIGGVIGGLLAKAAPDVFTWLIQVIR